MPTMISRLLTLALWTLTYTGSSASRLEARDNSTKPIEWITRNTSLPKVLLYDLDGTILKNSNYSRLDTTQYGSGPPTTIQQLIGNVSEVLQVAQIGLVDLGDTPGSASANSSLWMQISRHASKYLCEDESVVGAVMIHGTDTMGETIFGIDATLACEKPFVATGAMRPASYVSPDGLANFYNAISTAVHPSSGSRGALIVMNDRVWSAYYATKVNANNLDAFRALEQGALGAIVAGMPYYYFGTSMPSGRTVFDVSGMRGELPNVATLYHHQGFDASPLGIAVAHGAKGLVLIGPGAGSLSEEVFLAVYKLAAAGIQIAIVPRPASGTTVAPSQPMPFLKPAYLGADQARIVLQLCLASGYDLEQTREVMEGPMRRVIMREPNLSWFT